MSIYIRTYICTYMHSGYNAFHSYTYLKVHVLFNSCRRKTASGNGKAPPTSENDDHTKQHSDVCHTPLRGEDSSSKEGSVSTGGKHGSTCVPSSVESNRQSSPTNGSSSTDKCSLECDDHGSGVQGDAEAVHTVKWNDPQTVTLQPDSTLKPPEPHNCQSNDDNGAGPVAERTDSPRRQDEKGLVSALCPSQEEMVGEPRSFDVVATPSIKDTDTSVGQTPSTSVCPDGARESVAVCVSVKSVDTDNSEDGIYSVCIVVHVKVHITVHYDTYVLLSTVLYAYSIFKEVSLHRPKYGTVVYC